MCSRRRLQCARKHGCPDYELQHTAVTQQQTAPTTAPHATKLLLRRLERWIPVACIQQLKTVLYGSAAASPGGSAPSASLSSACSQSQPQQQPAGSSRHRTLQAAAHQQQQHSAPASPRAILYSPHPPVHSLRLPAGLQQQPAAAVMLRWLPHPQRAAAAVHPQLPPKLLAGPAAALLRPAAPAVSCRR